MELYIVNFYDNEEEGNFDHNELYCTRKAAEHRYYTLINKLNCYSWASIWTTKCVFGRVKYDDRIANCPSCKGEGGYCSCNYCDF